MPPCSGALPGDQGKNAPPAAMMSNMAAAPVESQPQVVPSSSSSTSSLAPTIEFPSVDEWFSYLDQHGERNQDGISFSLYGAVLKTKGFLRLSHLTTDFFTIADLQQWLGIEPGTAVAIMHYAKEDLDALRSGRWVFPKHL